MPTNPTNTKPANAVVQGGHTPPPYRQHEKHGVWVIGQDGQPVAYTDCLCVTHAQRKANAAFIVTACNSHARLVNALRNMVSRYDDNSPEANTARALLSEIGGGK